MRQRGELRDHDRDADDAAPFGRGVGRRLREDRHPRQVVRERVLVGFHYKRERRHGSIVKVRIGGHYRSIRIVIPANTRCGHKLVKTGPRLWQETTVCRPLGLHVVTTKLVPYGKPFTIHGLLVTTQGVPVANAPVDILTAPANGLWQFTKTATATTMPNGAWTAKLPPGPSRIIRTVWYPRARPPAIVALLHACPEAVAVPLDDRRQLAGGTPRSLDAALGCDLNRRRGIGRVVRARGRQRALRGLFLQREHRCSGC